MSISDDTAPTGFLVELSAVYRVDPIPFRVMTDLA